MRWITLEKTIQAIQNKANEEIQRLQSELAAANRNLEVMAAVSERMQNTKNERISKMETEHRQQINNLKQDAEKSLNERLNTLVADHEEEIQKLMAENKELKSNLSTPLVTETETQTEEFPQPNATTLAEVVMQTEQERPDSPPPMLDEFPADSEGPLTRPKHPHIGVKLLKRILWWFRLGLQSAPKQKASQLGFSTYWTSTWFSRGGRSSLSVSPNSPAPTGSHSVRRRCHRPRSNQERR